MGSGGLGGYVGYLLSCAGNDVHFIARGAHLDTLHKNGLRLITNEGKEYGIATPMNLAIYAALSPYTNGSGTH